MCGVSDNAEKTDTDITETPIGSVSLIIDTLGAVANVIEVCLTLATAPRVSMISDTEPIGVGDHQCSVNRHRTSLPIKEDEIRGEKFSANYDMFFSSRTITV
jgi:hypothetical protein